jgi:pyruvate/2-oxoglutarate dehydrogenase complex dihydrolipoamide acyltransferase (E2) component
MNSEQPGRRTRAGIFAFTLCVCVLACMARTPSASAQDAGVAADDTSAEYRELIEQALSEFKHKNWPEARVLFRRAHELSPNARTLRGMGVVSYEMRDYVHAVLELSSALTDPRQPLNDAQRKECENLLGRSRTFVGAYALKLEPSQAEVSLDGSPLLRDAEGRVLVSFGEHTLRAAAPGYQDTTSHLSVQGGEQGELRIVLYRPQPAAAAAAPVSSVEKTVRSEAPTQPVARNEAEHPSRRRGFRDHGLRYSWVALGTGAVLGAAAAGTWFMGQGKVDDLDASCAQMAAVGAPCVRGQVDTDQVRRFERATTALLGLTGAAVIAAGVLFTLEWPRERASAQKMALELSPQRISVRGNF